MRSGRARQPRASIAASAASTIVSDSGRGTSVAASMRNGRLQNSLWPTNARNRLACKPTSYQCGDCGFFIDAEAPRAGRRKRRMIEAESVTDEDAGIEVGDRRLRHAIAR